MPALCIHSPKLDALYRSYLKGKLSEGQFSNQLDKLIIDAAAVTDSLLPMGPILPTSERQARPLTKLELQQAWAEVTAVVRRGQRTVNTPRI